MKIILIIILILILLGHGGLVGTVISGLLHTIAGMSITAILAIVIILMLLK